MPPWSESLAEIHDATLLRRRTSSVSELPDADPWCDTGFVGSSEFAGYCSFTKAIEHLGDRWILLIVRELGVFGPLGFNELATALPGRISRSILADRLRRLEILGLVSRGDGHGAHAPYRLTAVGASLMPTILSLQTPGCPTTRTCWSGNRPSCSPGSLSGWLLNTRLPARLSSSSGCTTGPTGGTGS